MSTRTPRSPVSSTHGRITIRRLAATHGVTNRDIIRAVRAALREHPCRSLAVVVVDDERISRLHERFMAEPGPTDVLAFDLRDNPVDEPIEGEIIVSSETAERQARRYRATPAQELLRYAIHGTLHLTGLDDRTPQGRRRMRREENRILSWWAAGVAGPEPPARTGHRSGRKRQRTTGGV